MDGLNENIQVQPDPIDKKIIQLVKQHQQEADKIMFLGYTYTHK